MRSQFLRHLEEAFDGIVVALASTIMCELRAVPLSATVPGLIQAVAPGRGIAIESVNPGAIVVVRTAHSVYRLVVLNVSDRTVLVHGGDHFPIDTTAILQGSTVGGNFVKAGWIGVGLRMDLSVGRRTVVTSPVSAITVET